MSAGGASLLRVCQRGVSRPTLRAAYSELALLHLISCDAFPTTRSLLEGLGAQNSDTPMIAAPFRPRLGRTPINAFPIRHDPCCGL